MGKRLCILVSAILLVSAGAWLVSTSRAAYETASYEVVRKDGDFEVRRYPALCVVVTKMSAGERDGSFRRLFQYISGENDSEQSIAMTTPVFMPSDSDGTMREMQFVLPESIDPRLVPDPLDDTVSVETVPGGDYAVLRYDGRNERSAREEQLARLRKEIDSRELSAEGDPVFAGYDPPWTPAPVRRNEVLLRLR